MAVELSYCVVNTEQRQLLRYCLDSIARERAAVPVSYTHLRAHET